MIFKSKNKMETQTQPRLTGAPLFRKMLENKKIIQAQAVEDYKNNPEMQAAFKRLEKIEADKKLTKLKDRK
jgi:hypothetical protein